jgi:hypothetical protein
MLDPYGNDTHTFLYLPSINRFVDAQGCSIIHDLSRMFHTWKLDQWKKTQDYGLIRGKDDQLYDFYYLDEEFLLFGR